MKTRILPFLAFLLVLSFTSSCAKFHSLFRAKPQEVSDFLPHHERLVKCPDTKFFHYVWTADKIRPPKYVRIAPVNTKNLRKASAWAEFDLKASGGMEKAVGDLGKHFQEKLIEEFKKIESPDYFLLTDDPKEKDCMVLETAIVAIAPTKAELNALGFAVELFVPCVSILTSPIAEGSITIECRLRDAMTDEIVSMYATTECDPVAVVSLSGYTWLGTAYNNVESVARMTANCFTAEYDTLKRDFPIKLFSF